MTRPARIVQHQGPGYDLVQADCIEYLYRIPAASVDLVFADPPYYLSNGGTTCRAGKRAPVDKAAWDRSAGLLVDVSFHRAWLRACQRVLKPTGTLWASGTQHAIFAMGFAMQELGYHLLNTVTWFKPNASPNLACRFFTHSTELVIWAAPAPTQPLAHHFDYAAMKAANGGKQMRDAWELRDDGRGAVWPIPSPPSREKLNGRHPTQKPLALLERIVTAASRPGDLVLDPFNGSGTTGVAAVSLGRRYLGLDLEGHYLDLTERRLAALRGERAAALDDAQARAR